MIEGYEWYAVIGIWFEIGAFFILFFHQKLPSTFLNSHYATRNPNFKLKLTGWEIAGFLIAVIGLGLQMLTVMSD